MLKNHGALGRALVVAPSEDTAAMLHDDYQALEHDLHPQNPSKAVLFSDEEDEEKMASLSRWTLGEATLLFAPWDLVSVPLPPQNLFSMAHKTLSLGQKISRDDFFSHLLTHGYERVERVEKTGEVAVRGEVLDLWSPGWDEPLRALWPFDEIESLRKINRATQLSGDLVDNVRVTPARMTPTDDTGSTLLDYLGTNGTLFESHPSPDRPLLWNGPRVVHDPLGSERANDFASPPPLAGQMNLLAKEIHQWLKDHWRVRIFCHNAGEQERMEEILLQQDRGFSSAFEDRRLDLPLGHLTRGFLDLKEKTAVLSNGEIFGRGRRRVRLPPFTAGNPLGGAAELRQGDFVVHEGFGIGRYTGLERKNAGGLEGDYLRLEYRGGDRVFVPLFEFRQVKKFIGTEGKRPVLSSLDTATWDRTRADVEQAVAEMARDLLARAALRNRTPGFAFPPESPMEEEFGKSFLYQLTPDQARAIEETKQDMQRPTPMDRLVCGDVGYGKTEVALRAAFKAVTAGKQVALLVPTTILAEQHGRLFKERLADYPVTVAVLSRFTPPEEEKKALDQLRRGLVDVVVGTHRLLSKDVEFKDLGLLIIDEEHRFGVKQKERFMAFREVVDVLALSATPIPRTMGQALGGIKALSVIESPPEGRLPISTHVGPFDRKIVIAAVEQELKRGGQVFYVHNRVGSIERRRDWLLSTLNEHGLTARVGLIHGQMTGPKIEQVMWEFLHRHYDILLATTIIESGLDIPTVNTLVVEEAEDFGLAQLYQLRGRVGRKNTRAFCFLFHAPDATLSEGAEKRLSALKEFASLGSGFKLAMRDLEIRGAGNLLGAQQHGYVNAVGLDLYGQLLTEEIDRQKDDAPHTDTRPPRPPDPSLELPVSAYLPEDYMPSETERVLFYKRLLDANRDGLKTLAEELEDRCGRLPDPAEQLFATARLRLAAMDAGVTHVALVKGGVEFRFAESAVLSPDILVSLTKKEGPRFSFLPGPPFGMRFEEPLPIDLVAWATTFLTSLTNQSLI